MKQDINELKRLFYSDRLTQHGKRKLIGYYEKRTKELKEENEQLKLKERSRVLGRYGEIEVHDLINKTLANDYISTSLVEEKIEELNKEEKELQDSITEEEREEYSDANISYGLMLIENQRKVLQELLEKR